MEKETDWTRTDQFREEFEATRQERNPKQLGAKAGDSEAESDREIKDPEKAED